MTRNSSRRDAAHAIGTAYLVGGDVARGVAALDEIEPDRRDAAAWNDVAAAKWMIADKHGRPEELLEAIDASAHALALDPALPEGWFNRAIAIDSLGLTPVAHAAWRKYLSLDSASKWSPIARELLSSSGRNDSEAWSQATTKVDRLSESELARLAVRFPQQSRTHAEGPFLASWAEAITAGKTVEAANHLSRARTIGEALSASSGEEMVIDAVEAIERADPKSAVALSKGHLAYRAGRLAYRDSDLSIAEKHFTHATRLFRDGRSPMSAVAEYFLASVLFDENRVAEALDVMTPALASARNARGHKALVAQLLWEIALCEAVRGHWSDSLAAAGESSAVYQRLGESGNAAATEAILSEDYDLLGHREEAWRHGTSALRAACRAGDVFRARVILAALCRTELRAGRWPNAGTLIALERELAVRRNGKIDTDMHLRDAAVQLNLGNTRGAESALERARAAARSMPDGAGQAKLLADVDAVAGSILRPTDPQRAIRDLSSAIAFQQKATRPIVLPELFLERGRANLALDRGDAAARDFEDGIRELERERGHVSEAELRPGIFDDAAELFDEAISLRIRHGASVQDVLSTVERGRARAVLEQIQESTDLTSQRALTISEIQDQLEPGAAFIEYVTLPDRLAIFVIRRSSFLLRTAATPRSALIDRAREFTNALGADTPLDATKARSAALYEHLLAPIEDQLANATSVIIVPDAALQRVPFAALYDRKRKSYLVERWTTSIHPSAGVFIATERLLRRFRGIPVQTAVVFANPTVPRNEYPDLPSLSGSETEAGVAEHYRKRAVFLNNAASARRFLDVAPSYDVVHFAGHAVVETTEPGSSALIFASSAGTRGALTLRAIAQMRFRSTRVVVLAACSTMTGRNAAIEGVPSLARAFLVARVPAVIGTLWDIQDRDAAPLMDALHREIARGAPPATALRTAQLKALKSANPTQRHPAFWAAFSLTGN